MKNHEISTPSDREEILGHLRSEGIIPRHEYFEVGFVLFAACFVGANEERVSRLTGLSLSSVNEIGARLRRSQLWQGEQISYSDWDEEDPARASLNLFADLMVGKGELLREGRKTPSGKFVYRSLICKAETVQ